VCGGIGESGAIVFVRGPDPARLGYVMAHKLGHMLLGSNARPLIGIMRGTFFSEDCEKAAQALSASTDARANKTREVIARRSHN